MASDNAPHSLVLWIKWELHERLSNGQLSGIPKDSKEFHGVLHCENRTESKEIAQNIINKLTEDLKKCQQELQSKNQTLVNSNQPE